MSEEEISGLSSGTEWKEFQIGDLFERIPTRKLPYKASECAKSPTVDFVLPALTAGAQNQGLSVYVPYKGATVLKNCVSVAANGNAGVEFYHDENFTILQDAYAIRLKDHKGNREIYLFLITCMQKAIKGNFNWSNKATWSKVKALSISVPVVHSGDPDFPFMEERVKELEEERVKELEEERVKELEAYLKAAELDDYELTEKERKILDEMNIKGTKWAEFRIGDLFNVQTTKSIDRNKTIRSNNGEYDFIGRSYADMGIQGKVRKMNYNPCPQNTFSLVQIGKSVALWRENEWYASQNIFVLIPLYEEIKAAYLFIQTSINKALLPYKEAYVYPTLKTLKDIRLKLPITFSGDPDFEYMKQYTRAIEKEIIKNLYEYREKEVETTKEIVKREKP